MNAHQHYLRAWRATHANGWETWVAESESHDYAVWICPAGQDAVVDCIEDNLRHGQDAALLALAERTGHRCETGCGGWGRAEHSPAEN